MLTKHLIIYGRVQGVGYRYSMTKAAERMGVNGWVRNRHDGTVEAIVQGEDSAVEHLLVWANRGPELAAVSRVDIAEDQSGMVYEGFTQRPTV